MKNMYEIQNLPKQLDGQADKQTNFIKTFQFYQKMFKRGKYMKKYAVFFIEHKKSNENNGEKSNGRNFYKSFTSNKHAAFAGHLSIISLKNAKQ